MVLLLHVVSSILIVLCRKSVSLRFSAERKSGHVHIDFTFEYVLNGFCSPRSVLIADDSNLLNFTVSLGVLSSVGHFLRRHRARHLTSAPRKH